MPSAPSLGGRPKALCGKLPQRREGESETPGPGAWLCAYQLGDLGQLTAVSSSMKRGKTSTAPSWLLWVLSARRGGWKVLQLPGRWVFTASPLASPVYAGVPLLLAKEQLLLAGGEFSVTGAISEGRPWWEGDAPAWSGAG